ncbi:MAG: CZB domain-containing protein [Aquificaceae bacterium]
MRASILDLLREIDVYLSQHALYISNLRKAIKERKPFQHKTCRECNFGLSFYSNLYPHIDELDPELKKLVLEVEKIHFTFHEIAHEIDTTNPREEDLSKIEEMEKLSKELMQKLLLFKRSCKVLS